MQIYPTIVLVLSIYMLAAVSALSLSFPGGSSISLERGGVLRIRWQGREFLPESPPEESTPSLLTLSSIEIRDTATCKGFGAFCTKPLGKHTFLGFYEGTLLSSREELEFLYPQNQTIDYAMSLDGGATFLDGYDRAQDRSCFSPVFLNHEDKDRLGCNCLRILKDGNVAFFTSREIEAGSELCFDYGSNYWKGRENQKV